MDSARCLIVLGHAKTSSLGHRIVSELRRSLDEQGGEVRVHDLLEDSFDPVLRLEAHEPYPALGDASESLVARYREDVLWARLLVIVHPVWWFAPPAILKGWVDRVLVDGVALRQGRPGAPEPLLGGRRALVVQTFKATRDVDRGAMAGLAERFWTIGVFPSVGILRPRRLPLYRVESISPARLERFLRRLSRAVNLLSGGSGGSSA